MNKLISIVVIVIVIFGGFYLFKNKTVAPVDTADHTTDHVGDTVPVGTTGDWTDTPEVGAPTTKEFTVEASSFAFSPKTLTVNKGDTVKITVKNSGGVHDLRIDEFNAKTNILNSGGQQTITFVADKSGTFEYYCSVGTHRQMGMVGTLTVK